MGVSNKSDARPPVCLNNCWLIAFTRSLLCCESLVDIITRSTPRCSRHDCCGCLLRQLYYSACPEDSRTVLSDFIRAPAIGELLRKVDSPYEYGYMFDMDDTLKVWFNGGGNGMNPLLHRSRCCMGDELNEILPQSIHSIGGPRMDADADPED